MALPTLRHYSHLLVGADFALRWRAVGPSTPTARALVISKAVVMNEGPFIYLYVGIFSTAGLATGAEITEAPASNQFVRGLVVNGGEQWTETGLVVPAGSVFGVYANGNGATSQIVSCNIFGEEVDN